MKRLQFLLRPILTMLLLDVFLFGFGQTQFVTDHDNWNGLITEREDLPLELNQSLLVDVWAKEITRRSEHSNFGLRFTPESDQNVYLLYKKQLIDRKSKAEIGFSMNNFNALTLKFSRSFSITDLIKE